MNGRTFEVGSKEEDEEGGEDVEGREGQFKMTMTTEVKRMARGEGLRI